MSVISQLQNLANSVRVQSTQSSAPAAPQAPKFDDVARSDFLEARSRLVRIQRALETLAEFANISTRFRLDLPDAQSTQGLALDLTNTAATLASTEEINASPMSFTPFGPEWTGISSAAITIGGEYDGSQGTDQLTFEVRRPGTHGVNNLRIRVEDSQGNRIRNINIRRNDPPDEQYSLNNGLYLTLGPGFLIDLDTTTIDVFDSIGAVVDPNKPLGGIRNDNPNLQFGVPAIVDGSFQINGENISVSTTDTLSDVVNRINLSNAGVTAVFNAGTERIEFLQDTLGSVPTIDIQGDTSNFIEATKLDSAIVNPGIDPETIKVFEDVAAFSSIQTGNILINGQSIAVDSTTDSLTTVLDRINASSAGVTATFDAQNQRVTIESVDSASELDIDSNGTGLFAALYVPEGRVDPEVVGGGISLRRSYKIADAFEVLSSELNELFQDKTFKGGARNADMFRSPLDAAIRSVFGDAESIFGLTFDRSDSALRRGDFASIDRRDFTRSLQIRGDSVKEFFRGDDGEGGLIGGLLTATIQALQNVSYGLGQSGTFIDTFA